MNYSTNGLKKLTRPDVFVVVDTMVFLKGLGNVKPHSEALDCIKKVCNRIALSTEIHREYKCKVTSEGMTSTILERKIKELERMGKTRDVHRVEIDRAQARIREEDLRLPTDAFDHKFIITAIACGASYIITTDPSLLVLDPYHYNTLPIRVVEPITYVSDNCSPPNPIPNQQG
jgi:putative PIN family toxin of toxin-antitoxin system